MRKFLSLVLALFIVAGSIVPVFATSNSGSERTTVDVSDESIQSIAKAVTDSGSDDGNTVVDVSEESIMAIAEAVSSSTVTNKDGVTIPVSSTVLEYWNQYPIRIGFANGDWMLGLTAVHRGGSSNIFTLSGDDTLPARSYYASSGNMTTGTSVLFNVTSVLYSSVTLYADDGTVKYEADAEEPEVTYIVSFVTGFDDVVIESQSADSFVEPVPSKAGFVFEGWYFDVAYTTRLPTDYTFTENTTLYAKWTPLVLVSFDTGIDGYTIESQYTDNFVLPDAEYEGLIFLGWYLDPEFETPYSSPDFTENTTLYAKWTDTLPMNFFSGSIFEGLTALFESEPILYILSLMGLAIILHVIRMIISART